MWDFSYVWACALAAFLTLPALAQTARPKVRTLWPTGGQRGSAVAVTVAGLNLGHATAVAFERPGITVEGLTPEPPAAGAKNADGRFKATFKIAPEAPPGRHTFRVLTPFGPSEHAFFTVGEWPEVAEVEPNSSREAAQPLTGPVTVNARSDAPEDVDWFKIAGKPGESWVFEASALECFASPVEPVLSLRDEVGNEVASSAALTRAETRLVHTIGRAGTYFLQARDLRYGGSGDHHYRLSIGLLPVVSGVWPLGGAAGATLSLSVTGVNLPSNSAYVVLPEGEPGIQPTPLLSRLVPLDVAPGPASAEAEPNESKEAATKAGALPAVLDGRIEHPGDTDCFRFAAAKGQVIEIEAMAARLGSKLDGVLAVLASDGRELASNDDARGKDPHLLFTAPDAGEYIVRLTDMTGRGGRQWGYRLRLTPATPDFSLAVAPDCLALAPGDRVPVTVSATRRNGFGDEIAIEAPGLPAGVTLSGPLTVAAGQSEVTLLAVAAPDAPPASVPLTVLGRSSVGVRKAGALQEEYTKTPEGAIVRTTRPVPQPLACVVGPADLTASVSAEQLELKAGASAEVTVKITRRADFVARVPLIFIGLPAGVSAAPLEIAENQSEVKIALKAEASAAVGEHRVLLLARSVVDELRFSPHAAPPLTLRIVK